MSLGLSLFVSVVLICALAALFYFKSGWLNRLMVFVGLVGVWFIFVDKEFYSSNLIEGYGCIIGRSNPPGLMPKYNIKESSGAKVYSIEGADDYWQKKHIGKCGRLVYYNNILGNRILVEFSIEGGIRGQVSHFP